MNSYSWLMTHIRGFLAGIDAAIYGFTGLILELIFSISKVTVSQEVIKPFIDRIYILIAVYIIFKLAIALISAIANPDLLTDKNRGMGKFVQRVIVSIGLLVFTPTIFRTLFELQPAIIETIPRVILGVETLDMSGENGEGQSQGQRMAMNTMLGFAEYNKDCDVENSGYNSADFKSRKDALTGEQSDGFNGVNDLIKANCKGSNGKAYVINYTFFISTLAAFVMILVLISFAIDVSIRTIKLVVLQIISPIPIISYMDPTAKKDGSSFDIWVKEVTSTYLELFMKLASMYFVVYLIAQVFAADSILLNVDSGLVEVFLVLGLLLFGKALPGYISKLLGIKAGSGGSTGLAGLMSAGGAILGGAGLMGGLAAGGAALSDASTAMKEGKAIGSGSLGRGREIASALKSGDVSKLKTSGFGAKMVGMANRSNLKKQGISDNRVNELKQERDNKKFEAQRQQQMYKSALKGNFTAEEQAELDAGTISAEELVANRYASSYYADQEHAKASSDYDKAKGLYESSGMKTTQTFADKMYIGADNSIDFKDGMVSGVKATINAAAHPVQTTKRAVSGAAQGVVNVVNSAGSKVSSGKASLKRDNISSRAASARKKTEAKKY